MSMPTITLDRQVSTEPSSVTFHDRVTLPGDTSYPTGGTAGFAAKFQAITVADPRGGSYPAVPAFQGRTPIFVVGHGGAYRLEYDRANDKLMVFNTTTGAEVANATDLHTTTFTALVTSN